MDSPRLRFVLIGAVLVALVAAFLVWLNPRPASRSQEAVAASLAQSPGAQQASPAADAPPAAATSSETPAVDAAPAASPTAMAQPPEETPQFNDQQLAAQFQQMRQDVRWQQPVPEPELAQFRDWTQRYLNATPAEKAVLEEEGVRLAVQRQPVMEALIEEDSERALERAVPVTVRRQMPLRVIAQLEEHVNARGDLMVLGALPLPGFEDKVKPISRQATVAGRHLEAFVGPQRKRQRSKVNIPLHGIAMGEKMAVSEWSGRPLEPGEFAEAKAAAGADTICDISGDSTTANNDEAGVDIGGSYHFYCAKRHAMQELMALTDEERTATFGPGKGDTANSGWTEGTKKLLIMRVDFPDYTGGVSGQPAVDKLTAMVSQTDPTRPQFKSFWEAMSYGKTSWHPIGPGGSTLTPVLRLPQTSNNYTNFATMLGAARTAARSAGFNPDLYDFDMVITDARPNVGFAGVAYVGWKGCWLAGNNYWNQGVGSHELGHNFGLWHSSSWRTTDGTIIGAGNRVEYGDSFDTMGGAQSNAFSHFHSHYKNFLDWLPNADVRTITTSGTHRLLAHDVKNGVGLRGLKIARNTNQAYWIETRQLWANNIWSTNGVHIMWANRNGDDNSELLDMNPQTSTINDAPLVLGRTFTDAPRGIHITPVAKITGSTQNAIDVVVNIGTFPSNRKPTLSLSATPTPVAGVISVAPNAPVSFTATAADADNDTLAYYWDFGDNTFGTNSPAASKSWSAVAERVVRCTVTDMRGGTATSSFVVRIGNPSTFSINGRVTDDDGGVEGAQITAGSASAFSNTDGTYALVGLSSGSYTVAATAGGQIYLPQGFTNPVVVGPSKSGINFGASVSAPRMSVLPPLTVNLNTPVGPIPFTVEDRDSPLDSLSFSATSTNSTLLAPRDVVFGGSGANRTVSITPGTNQTGTAILYVTVRDGDNQGMTREWVITVNSPPSVTSVQQTTNEDTPVVIDLRQFANDNQTPKDGLFYSASNANKGVIEMMPDGFRARFTPSLDYNGSASFDLSVSDQSSEPRLFLYYSFEAPDGSSDSEAEDRSNFGRHGQITAIGGGEFTYADGEVPAPLGIYHNTALQLVQTRDGAGARLARQVTPAELNFNNQDWTFAGWFKRDGIQDEDIVFHLGSGSGDGSPGELFVAGVENEERVRFVVNGVSTTLNPVVAAGEWHHVAITYSRTAPNTGDFRVHLDGVEEYASSGVPLSLTQPAPVVFGGHDVTDTRSDRWFNGKLDELALWSAALSPLEVGRLHRMIVPHFSGSTRSATINLFVNPINDPPNISVIADQEIGEGGMLGPLPFTISDDTIPAGNLTVRAESNNHALVSPSAITFGGSGGTRTITVRPAPDRGGAAVITIFVSDGTLTGERQFTLTVSDLNDPPQLAPFTNFAMATSGGAALLPFDAADPDTAGADLIVTATSSNPVLFPDGSITVQGWANSRGLMVRPASGQSGSATITVTLDDSDTVVTQSFTINVAPAPNAGSWNGAVTSTPAIHSGTGIIQLKTTATGQFTAKVVRGGVRDSFKGSLPASGLSSPITSKTRRLTLQAGYDGDGRLSGTISDGTITSSFAADRALFTSAKSPRAPQRNVPAALLGRLTALLTPAGEGAPEGSGYAAVTVLGKGTVRIVGQLSNGAKFAHGNVLSQDGAVPFYVPLDRGAGAIAGELRWQPKDDCDWEGSARWFRAGAPPEGWELPCFGSTYTPPRKAKRSDPAVPPLPGLTSERPAGNAELTFTNPAMSKPVNLSSTGRFTVLQPPTNSERLKLKLAAKTGVIKGSFVSPATGRKSVVGGVLYQKTNQAGGFHSESTQSGAFSLELAP